MKHLTLAALSLAILASSCKKKDATQTSTTTTPTSGPTYAVHGSTSNGSSSYVLESASLTGGNVTAVGNGADVTTFGTRPENMMVKNGYYYNLNNTNTKFGKYQYQNNTLTAVTEIPFTAFTAVRSSNWIDDNTLLISGENNAGTAISYAIINVQSMTISSSGDFPLPAAPAANYFIQAGSTFKRGNRMFIGYSYYYNGGNYAIADTVYTTAVDYPSMANPVHFKDVRSAGAGGGCNMSWSYVDANNDIYVMTCPSDFYGVSSKPTAILRIKSGQEKFDTSYFFNLSAQLGNDDPLTITYAGNGKVITKNAKQSLIINYSDFTAGFIYQYYVIDMNAQTLTNLNTPLHMGLFTNVLLDNGKAYFADNSQSNGAYVYGYDPSNGAVSKGLGISGLTTVNWVGRVQ